MNDRCNNLLSVIDSIEENIEDLEPNDLRIYAKGLMKIERYMQEQLPGIFDVALKWCNLYLCIQDFINPQVRTLRRLFEDVAISTITYIIGYLQYTTEDIADYHFKLLKIMERLLRNLPCGILEQLNTLQPGIIACMWTPYSYGINHKTQMLILRLFAMLMKCIDTSKWDLEFKAIKLRRFNINENELINIIKETQHPSMYLKRTREFLNNYNHVMNNTKNLSFYCDYINIGNKYDIFKRLNFDKFWIDLNIETLSFEGRFKPCTTSDYRSYKKVEGIFQIENIKIESGFLLVYFNDSNIDSFPITTNENVLQIFLSNEEQHRIRKHEVLHYFLYEVATRGNVAEKYEADIPQIDNNEDDPLQDNIQSEDHNNDNENLPDNFEVPLNDTTITPRIEETNNVNENPFNDIDDEELISQDVIENILERLSEVLPEHADTLTRNHNEQLETNLAQSPQRASPPITGTPVSSRRQKCTVKTKHAIYQLRSKRQRKSEDSDEDYVPNKKPKKRPQKQGLKKQHMRNNVKPSPRAKTKIDNPQSNEKLIENEKIIENKNIINITENLIQGNTCQIQESGTQNQNLSNTNGVHSEANEDIDEVLEGPLECSDFQAFRDGIEFGAIHSSKNIPNQSAQADEENEVYDSIRSYRNSLEDFSEIPLLQNSLVPNSFNNSGTRTTKPSISRNNSTMMDIRDENISDNEDLSEIPRLQDSQNSNQRLSQTATTSSIRNSFNNPEIRTTKPSTSGNISTLMDISDELIIDETSEESISDKENKYSTTKSKNGAHPDSDVEIMENNNVDYSSSNRRIKKSNNRGKVSRQLHQTKERKNEKLFQKYKIKKKESIKSKNPLRSTNVEEESTVILSDDSSNSIIDCTNVRKPNIHNVEEYEISE
ncbi:uncharacterized protein [Musca autumnalis]|uniref:uncharacterized protein n=1 Tax=Musca autumnalis TaxID=221902 RepID=UPI003CE76C49